MSKKLFSDEEIKSLSKNSYVKSVSKRGITYTDEFKILFIAERSKGKLPIYIFQDAEFDVDVIGNNRIWCASKRWRNAYNESGVLDLRDSRKLSSGCPLKRELTVEEIIAKRMQKLLIGKLSQNYKNMVSHLCEVALVSKSGYYNYLKSTGKRNRREEKDLELKDITLKAFNHRGYKKGPHSIKMVLENEFNLIINRKCIQRIMRKYNIEFPIRKANPYRRMMKATREHTVVPNILNREFNQYLVGKVLLTDVTYLTYGASNRAYLSTIKDAFIHSDQGVHYTSPRFQKLLKKYKIGQSMSRRGNCWDNAPQESFFGHMKDEIDLKGCSTFEELEASIDNYMDYYNNYRYQWGLKKLAPVQYRNQLIAA